MSGLGSIGVSKVGLCSLASSGGLRAANVVCTCLKNGPLDGGRLNSYEYCRLGGILAFDQPSPGFDQTCTWTARERFCLMDDGAGCHFHAPYMWAAHGQMGTCPR